MRAFARFDERDLNVGCQFAMCIENGQNWPHTDGLTRSAQPQILFDNLIINLHNNIRFDWMAHIESNRKTNTHAKTAARATVIGCVFAMGAQMRIYFFLIVVINRFGAPQHGFTLRNILNQFNANLFLCGVSGLTTISRSSKANRMERMLLRAYAIDSHAARVVAFTFDLLVVFSLFYLSAVGFCIVINGTRISFISLCVRQKPQLWTNFFSLSVGFVRKSVLFLCARLAARSRYAGSAAYQFKNRMGNNGKKPKLFHSIYAWVGCRANVFVDANCLRNSIDTHIRFESDRNSTPALSHAPSN